MGRRLVSYGHEVHMITSYRKEDTTGQGSWYYTNEEGINVHWLPVPYSNKMSYKARIQAFLSLLLKQLLRKDNYGIL